MAIDLFVCRSDYWLVIYKIKQGWQFALYFPSKNFHCTINNFCYSTRLGCLNSAKQVAANFLQKIAEL